MCGGGRGHRRRGRGVCTIASVCGGAAGPLLCQRQLRHHTHWLWSIAGPRARPTPMRGCNTKTAHHSRCAKQWRARAHSARPQHNCAVLCTASDDDATQSRHCATPSSVCPPDALATTPNTCVATAGLTSWVYDSLRHRYVLHLWAAPHSHTRVPLMRVCVCARA